MSLQGLPQDYFDRYDDGEIAQHLTAFMSAKKLAASADPTIGKDATQVRLCLTHSLESHAFVIHALMSLTHSCVSRSRVSHMRVSFSHVPNILMRLAHVCQFRGPWSTRFLSPNLFA